MRNYEEGEDLHRRTVAEFEGIDYDDVPNERRKSGKILNFSQLNGTTASGLKREAKTQFNFDMTDKEAREKLRKYKLTYPELAMWKAGVLARAQAEGITRTRLGLIRDYGTQGSGYLGGQAPNVVIQGSAGEVMLSAIARLPEYINGDGTRVYSTIHDELILSVPEGSEDKAKEALEGTMVQGFEDVFPEFGNMTKNLVEAKMGRNWNEVK